nr:regulatory protein RecX [Thiolinea sp.]
MVLRSALAKGQGPVKITHALREKGVSNECIRALMDACETDWLALARSQRERRFGADIPGDFKERARQSRFLAGRGFYVDTINAVFHEEC